MKWMKSFLDWLTGTGNVPTSLMTNRYRYARGPVCNRIKEKLLVRMKQGSAESVADDILELIAVARNDPEGFRAAERELDRLMSFETRTDGCKFEGRTISD